MKGQWMQGWRAVLVLLATAALGVAAPRTMPTPGTLNYIEGQVSMNGQELSGSSVGSAVLAPDQVLNTGQGRAEVLLTPGVFLRIGDNSQLRMVSPGLADTRVELLRGSAMLEVAELFKANDLAVQVDGLETRIEKNGLYSFNADRPSVSVLDGRATVTEGDSHVTLKKGHMVLAATQPLKSQSFDAHTAEAEPLYRWSMLRSQYAAEANIDTAQTVMVNGGWYGPGWYWDPYWSFYSFLPGDGILYSPWGWGFYSPGWAWRAPGYYRYPYGRGYGVRSGLRAGAPAGRAMSAPRMSAPMSHGFSGGGGGFRGGGGGGGRR